MGTFSKTMFPGMRLGYMVLPPGLATPFITGMEELHRSGQTPLQATMAEFMQQGHFTSHIRRMRILYGRRNEILQEAVRKHFDAKEVLTVGTDAGLHLALKFPAGVDDKTIAQDANTLGIAVRPLSSYFHDASSNDTGLVLGYACVEDSHIEPAFALLAKAIRQGLQK